MSDNLVRAKHLVSVESALKNYVDSKTETSADNADFATDEQVIEAFNDGWNSNDSLPANDAFDFDMEKIFGIADDFDAEVKTILEG